MLLREAWGWLEVNKACIIAGIEPKFCTKNSDLIFQGSENQAALAKGQVKNRCISSSSWSHLAHCFIIWEENLPALIPVGIALLSSLHAKVCTLGTISFALQVCFKICFTHVDACLGKGSPCSCISCRQALYADLELHFPELCSFQHRMSVPSNWIIGTCIMMLAACSSKSVQIRLVFQAFWLGSYRSLTCEG